jgi:hypothetical protein
MSWGRSAVLRAFKLGAAAALACAVDGCSYFDFGFMSSPAPAPSPASSFRVLPPDPLIGKWGVASYRNANDRPAAEKLARERCASPYLIVKGPTDGAMMNVAEDPDPHELALKRGGDGRTYVGFNAPPGDPNDRELIEQTPKLLVMRFVDPDKNSRYGAAVYMRC